MAYTETPISGNVYTRANEVRISNPYNGPKSLQFVEENVYNFGNDLILRPAGGVTELFNSANAGESFNLMTPIAGQSTLTYQDLYIALNSLYIHVATKRDQAIAQQAAAAAVATPAPAPAGLLTPMSNYTPE